MFDVYFSVVVGAGFISPPEQAATGSADLREGVNPSPTRNEQGGLSLTRRATKVTPTPSSFEIPYSIFEIRFYFHIKA
jgi:hypothetical protein